MEEWRAGLKRFARTFFVSLGFLVGVLYVYVLQFAPTHASLLWLALPIAVLLAAGKDLRLPALHTIRTLHHRITAYEADLAEMDAKRQQALNAAAQQTAVNQDLVHRVTQLEEAVDQAFARGIRNGRRRAVGELMAAAAGAELRPVGLVMEDEQLVVVANIATGRPPSIGSHYLLRVYGTKAKAVLAVKAVDVEKAGVMLLVDEVVDSSYMEGLVKRASSGESDPPLSLKITHRDPDAPESFLHEDWVDE